MKRLQLKYTALQSCYWMLFCAAYGYVTVYLLGNALTAGQIGLLTAASGVLAALGQPVAGRIADSGRLSWKALLQLLAAVGLLLLGGLSVCADKWVSGILWASFMMVLNLMMPLVNAVPFYYAARGGTLDFGMARGSGSLCYAFISMLLGQLTARLGTGVVVAVSAALFCLFLGVTFTLPCQRTAAPRSEPGAAAHKGFFARYPRYTAVLVSCILLLGFHNITNTYLIQIITAVGGDSGSLGTALAIAAVLELPVMFGFTRIVARHTPARLLIVCGAAFFLKSICYLISGSVVMIYATQLLQTFSFALYASASVYYADSEMALPDKATGQGYMTCTISAGGVLGNLLGGAVVDAQGVPAMLWVGLGLAAAGALLLYFTLRKQA